MTDRQLARGEDIYIESPVIMTTVRLVAPLTLTYGLYTAFHGAASPGGAFQGGTIVGATVLMIAFAFGIAPTRRWIANDLVVGLMAGGTVFFGFTGLLGFVGGTFLDHGLLYRLGVKKGVKWSMELLEIGGIFLILIGTFVGLFFVMASGFNQVYGGDRRRSSTS